MPHISDLSSTTSNICIWGFLLFSFMENPIVAIMYTYSFFPGL